MNTYTEYSEHQQERIAKAILETYKDGTYAFDENVKRQRDVHYNKKSEVKKLICEDMLKDKKWAKYIIPLIDWNLETDYYAIEEEWEKNHRMAIKVEDFQAENKLLKNNMEALATKKGKKLMEGWVSEKEDIAKLHEENEEIKNRMSESIRRHQRSTNGLINQNSQLQLSLEKIKFELRDERDKSIECELDEKKKAPSLKKQVKRLETQNSKLEKETLKLQKQKMEGEMKYLKLKQETDERTSQLKTEIEKIQIELNYYKITHSVEEQSPPLHLLHQEAVADVPDQDPVAGGEVD